MVNDRCQERLGTPALHQCCHFGVELVAAESSRKSGVGSRRIGIARTRWLQKIVDNQGWPTKTLVGEDGANAAWLLVQHADADSQFQRKCLDLMTKLPKGEVSQVQFAYLTDRVLLAEGKKQIYGTQFHAVDGKLQPRPLEDEANVDKRRADIGLPPLADYAKELEKVYGGGSK